MKKKIKSALAIILALMLCFGSISASAADTAENEKLIIWDTEYIYAGEATEGENSIDYNEDICFYYDVFNVTKAGYYLFTFSEFTWFCIPDEFDEELGQYITLKENFYSFEEGLSKSLMYLEPGKTFIAIDLYSDYNGENKYSIEYFAEEISDIYIQEFNKDLIYYNDEFYFSDDSNYGEVYSVPTVTFSNGKTFEPNNPQIISFETELIEGNKYNFTVTFGEYSKVYEVTRGFYADFVKDIKLSNEELFLTVFRDYSGYYFTYNGFYVWEPFFTGESVTITYTDGKTFTAPLYDYNYGSTMIVLPSGEEAELSIHYNIDYDEETDEESVSLVYAIGNEEIIARECEIQEQSTGENFLDIIYDGITDRLMIILEFIIIARGSDFSDLIYLISDYATYYFDTYTYQFEEFASLIEYYFSSF